MADADYNWENKNFFVSCEKLSAHFRTGAVERFSQYMLNMPSKGPYMFPHKHIERNIVNC
jgi:hypothetical protein